MRVSIRLTSGERKRLARLVEAADLGAIEEDDSEPIPDAYSNSMRLGDDDAGWQAMYIPPELEALWAELETLGAKYAPQPE